MKTLILNDKQLDKLEENILKKSFPQNLKNNKKITAWQNGARTIDEISLTNRTKEVGYFLKIFSSETGGVAYRLDIPIDEIDIYFQLIKRKRNIARDNSIQDMLQDIEVEDIKKKEPLEVAIVSGGGIL